MENGQDFSLAFYRDVPAQGVPGLHECRTMSAQGARGLRECQTMSAQGAPGLHECQVLRFRLRR